MPLTAPPPGYRIENEDAALKYIRGLVDDVRKARAACDPRIATLVMEQRRNYHAYLMRHGNALGALTTLHRARLLGDNAYEQLYIEIMNTLAPSTIIAG